MQVKDVVVRAQALGGQWETIGATTLRERGVWPENVTLEADLWGSSTASFDLHRSDPRVPWPDIGAWTPVDIEVGGILVWSGRVSETPTVDGTDRVISVHCTGWQYHLDDDVYAKSYVHTAISEWRDYRTFPTPPVGRIGTAAGQVTTGDGVATFGWPKGSQLNTGNPICGIELDLGPNCTATRIVIQYEWASRTASSGVFSFYAKAGASEDLVSTGDVLANMDIATLMGASGTVGWTVPGAARRYWMLSFYFAGGANATTSEDNLLRIKSIQVFANAAYESGNVSILKASTVVADAVTTATDLLSTDRSAITTSAFSIPDLHFPTDPKTPREVIAAVNAYQDWLPSVGVDKRMCYRAKPTSPIVEVGSWAPLEVQDASANSGEDIYSRVIVTGTGPDGTPVLVTRTTTFNTLPTRRGFDRTKILPISARLTTAMANQLGDLWLAAHTTTPYKGSYAVSGDHALRDPTSGTFFPLQTILLNTGELIRDTSAIDPDTGGIGRDGRIASVSYKPETDEATITLDNSRANVEAFLARLDAISSAGK